MLRIAQRMLRLGQLVQCIPNLRLCSLGERQLAG